MSFLTRALQLHNSRLRYAAGEVVTYRRGIHLLEVVAVLGQSQFDDIAGDGEFRSLIKTVDFLITPDQLCIEGQLIEPQRGDQINRSTNEVFDLLSGRSSTPWAWSDGYQSHYRIHTVRRVKS